MYIEHRPEIKFVLSLRSVSDGNRTITHPNHDKCWPTKVTCEMNIGNWRDELEKEGLLVEYFYLLEGFAKGFHQGIPKHTVKDLQWFSPPNHNSAIEARNKIERNILKEVAAGRMCGPFTELEVFNNIGFFRTSPLGAVINGDGSFRPINDLSFPRFDPDIPSVNSFVNKDEFATTWDDFKVVAQFFRSLEEDVLMGLFDWEGAYRQIPTHPSQWPYLAIKDFNNNIYIDLRIAFGGVAGCGSFGGPADGWKCLMKNKFNPLEAFRWVDDNLMIKLASNTTSMIDIVHASERLGVKTNVTKYSEFASEQKFIGFLWNAKNKTVTLPLNKLRQRIIELDEFLATPTFKKSQVEKFNGKLSHMTLILPQLKAYLCENFKWVATWRTPGPRRMPALVREDLSYWKNCLASLQPTRLVPDPIVRNVGWVGDASSSFGIGIIIGKQWSQFAWLPGWSNPIDQPPRTIAWAETVVVRLGLLMLFNQRSVEGCCFSSLTDNTTTEGAARNRKSRDFWINDEWKRVQDLLIHHDCDISLVRVISADNSADQLSRGYDASKSKEDMVLVSVPKDLLGVLYQVLPI